jgi:hypothetical protein
MQGAKHSNTGGIARLCNAAGAQIRKTLGNRRLSEYNIFEIRIVNRSAVMAAFEGEGDMNGCLREIEAANAGI